MMRGPVRLVRAAWHVTWALVFLAAAPWVLIRYGTPRLPRRLPTLDELGRWLDNPDTPRALLVLVVILGWAGWVFFVVVLATETYGLLRHGRGHRIRLSLPMQSVAASIVGATATAFTQAAGHAAPPPTPPEAAVDTVPDPSGDIDRLEPPRRHAPAPADVRYVVAAGDRLADVAGRFLGDPTAYPSLAAANPDLEARDHRFPDHIEPGWRLRLPDGAHDRGARPHATGKLAAPPSTTPVEPQHRREPAPANGSPEQPSPPRMPTVDITPVDDEPPDDEPAGDETEPGEATADDHAAAAGEPHDAGSGTGTLAGAGLLTALLLQAMTRARRRQQPHFPAGMPLPNPRNGRTERRLLAAQQPADLDRLDHALCDLAGRLADRDRQPDVVGVRLIGGEVHVLLATPDQAPAPWLDEGNHWVLPADHHLPGPATHWPPLPALATVGSRSGRHLLLDLERVGVLAIDGNPERATELLLYLACELALSVWSEHLTVELVGFGAAAELIAELSPQRVRIRRHADEAITRLRTQLNVHTGPKAGGSISDTVAVRPQPPPQPLVVLVHRPDQATRDAIAALARAHAPHCRSGFAVVTTGAPTLGGGRLTVSDEGTLTVDLPWLTMTTDAAALPYHELAPIAEILHFARLVGPPSDGATDTTVTSARARIADSSASGEFDEFGDGPDTWPESDPTLDADLAAWHDPTTLRPKVALLGRLTVTAPGEARTNRRQTGELLVYLLARPDLAATREQIEDALWAGAPVNPVTSNGVVTALRRWLGLRPDGETWLSDTRGQRGGPYQLHPGILLDWDLFTRLRARAGRRPDRIVTDLRAALTLLRGSPFEGLVDATAHRRAYTWLPESSVAPGRIVPAITDVAHRLAQHGLAIGDTRLVRWAVGQAWLADPYRGTDDVWLDLMHAEHADGHTAQLRNLYDELLKAREAEVPEDLPPATYAALRTLLPDLTG